MKKCPRLYLVDGSSFIFRAFYGIRQFLSNSKGLPTNAIYGFATMMLKIIREEKPDYLVIVFDPKEKPSDMKFTVIIKPIGLKPLKI